MSEASQKFEVVRTQFGMVPEWVDEVVTDGTAMRVYVRLVRKYANARTRECHPSQHTLAEELGISATAVKRAIAHLRECGALFVKRGRQADGRLGRNAYWLPMDMVGQKYREWLTPEHQGSEVTPGAGEAPAQDQGPDVVHGDQGSNMSPGPGVVYDPSTNQTQKLTREKIPDAAAPEQEELDLPLPAGAVEEASEKAQPTANQRAVKLAQWYYDRLGGMGHVPAFIAVIKQAVVRDFTDGQIMVALGYIADHNWTLTAERLANALRGGPKPATSPPPTVNGRDPRKYYLPDGRELQRG